MAWAPPLTAGQRPAADSRIEVPTLPKRNLDLLRAIAVLCVLADHFATTWRVNLGPLTDTWAIGQLGVLIFFVHTSLVLMSSIEREGTHRRDWILAFYVRRALRIYPLVVAAILLVIAFRIPWRVPVVGSAGEVAAINARTLVSNLTLTQNLIGAPNILGVLWSLPIEVQMYVLLPLCYLVVKRSSFAVAAMVFTFASAWALMRLGVIPLGHRLWAVAYGPCFAGGLVAYHLARRGVRPRLPSGVWPLVVLGIGAMYVALHPSPQHLERGWLPCLCLGALIPLIADAPSSWLATAAHKICEMSYGIYLLNVPILWLSFIVLGHASLWLQWSTCVALLVIAPMLAYRYIEQPFVRLGRALVKGTAVPTSTSAVPSTPLSPSSS
jgi:peptidoglycan/LPS O-acetylase OafA/YrhL